MNINRNTYEEYFLMYVDNELSPAERLAVEAFVEENPDLHQELIMLQDAVLQPEPEIHFDNKKSLLRSANPVTAENCEEYFILYGDDELSLEEKEYTEQFVYRHPEHQHNFELFQAARLTYDRNIVFPDKEKLFRKEKKEGAVLYMRMMRYAVAASVLLALGVTGWLLNDSVAPKPVVVVQNTTERNSSPAKETPTQDLQPSVTETPTETLVPSSAIQPERNAGNQRRVEQLPAENNFQVASNKSVNENVTPERTMQQMTTSNNLPDPVAVDVALHQPQKEIFVIDEAVGELELNNNNHTTLASLPDIQEEADNDVVYFANTTVNKNQFRGLFRKASRFFEKATNIDPINEEKGIRIAGFEIARK